MTCRQERQHGCSPTWAGSSEKLPSPQVAHARGVDAPNADEKEPCRQAVQPVASTSDTPVE